jgi:hypothetical protein
MSALPPEGHPILVVDSIAVTTRLNAFQELETISGRNEQIFKSALGVEASSASSPNTGTAPAGSFLSDPLRTTA